MTATAAPAAGKNSDRRLLLFVLLNVFAINVLIKLFTHFVFHTALDDMRVRYSAFLHFTQATDSWLPMLQSVDYYLAHPSLPIYSAKLYDTLIYPLTSILPLLWMKKAGLSDAAVYRLLMLLSWLAVVAIVALQVWLASIVAKLSGRGKLTLAGAAATAVAAFFFMPITLAFSLGQAQIFLDLFFALLVLFWVQGRERGAGVMMALLAMVKPQFGLLLLWSGLRRKWNALFSSLATLAVGAVVSIASFGLRNNLDYISVLVSLSKKAQSHYANQSVFGMLNRAIFNGENIPYHPYVYPPYVAWVYHVTLITTAIFILLALVYPWRNRAGSMADLGFTGIVCVIATPMAWEHHYGIMLPIFVWFWFAVYRAGVLHPAWIALAFLLIADFLSFFNLLSAVPVANVLQTYMFFGALLLMFLLTRKNPDQSCVAAIR